MPGRDCDRRLSGRGDCGRSATAPFVSLRDQISRRWERVTRAADIRPPHPRPVRDRASAKGPQSPGRLAADRNRGPGAPAASDIICFHRHRGPGLPAATLIALSRQHST